MQKICVNIMDDVVNQIFNLSDYPEFNPDDYPYCYVIDDENDSITHYGFKYNKELEIFEEIEDYEESEVVIEPSKAEVVEKKTEDLQMELQLTQSAVDFLLMSDFTIYRQNLNKKGENSIMAGYFAMRIIKGMLNYEEVITRYPDYKEEIDFILRAEGKEYLIK